jgi:hypothetical protein
VVNLFRLELIKADLSKRYDITPIVGNIAWESNFTMTVAMDFETVTSDVLRFTKNPCDVGDSVILRKNNEEIYRGIIIEEQRQGRKSIKYSTYDYSFYLNESTSVYQFNKITSTQAIERVLNDFGIKIGSILNMPTVIDEIFMLKTPGQIIQSVIEKVQQQEGYMINAEMREGKIYFEKRNDLLIKGSFKLADNIAQEDTIASISEPSRKRSIKEMRNRIKIIVEDEETKYEVTAEKERSDLIQKYGLLEETLKIDAEDAAKSRQVARVLLERFAKIHETNEASFLGDIRFKAGRLFDIREPITGMNNRFIIASAKHKVNNQIHLMDLELADVSEVG